MAKKKKTRATLDVAIVASDPDSWYREMVGQFIVVDKPYINLFRDSYIVRGELKQILKDHCRIIISVKIVLAIKGDKDLLVGKVYSVYEDLVDGCFEIRNTGKRIPAKHCDKLIKQRSYEGGRDYG